MFTLAQAAAAFRRSAEVCEAGLGVVLGEGMATAATRAKAMIGHQQEGWAPLSERWTIPEKARLGFTPPDYQPLLRTGAMRESVESATEGLAGGIGSADKVALFQEEGTHGPRSSIPPRPFLSRALMLTAPEINDALGEFATTLLTPP